jgi:hypothetical protein
MRNENEPGKKSNKSLINAFEDKIEIDEEPHQIPYNMTEFKDQIHMAKTIQAESSEKRRLPKSADKPLHPALVFMLDRFEHTKISISLLPLIAFWVIVTALVFFGIMNFEPRSLDGAMLSGLVITCSLYEGIRFLRILTKKHAL